jgi:hypothetical protein
VHHADPLETELAGKAGSVYQPPALPSPDSAVSSVNRKIAGAGHPITLFCDRYASLATKRHQRRNGGSGLATGKLRPGIEADVGLG